MAATDEPPITHIESESELVSHGIELAGFCIEAGTRNFTQYAKLMIEDIGGDVKPYLLSFWEGARNYPGLDTSDMTGTTESLSQFQELINRAT